MIEPRSNSLHEDAHGERAEFRVELARRSANTTLEAVANHPRAAAHIAFFDRSSVRGIDRVESMLRFDVETVDVVEPAIPGFRDDGKRPPVALGIGRAVRDAPWNDGVADDADAVRVG